MGWMIYVTGGAYGGKDDFAKNMAKSRLQDVLHVTASDQDTSIEKKRMYRGKLWHHITQVEDLDVLLMNAQEHVALIDNLVDFTQQWIKEAGDHPDRIDLAIESGVEKLCRGIEGFSGTVIVVTTEMGLGLEDKRKRMSKLIGAMNRRLASFADEAWFMVSGIPTRLK